MCWFDFRRLVLALGLILGACQAGDEAAGTTAATNTRLVIYSGRSESLVGPIIKTFAETSGLQVEVRYGGTAELAATLLEEGANSPADVFFAQDPGGLGAVQAAGLLRPLPDEILARVPAGFAAPDGSWVGISGRARVVVYNLQRVDPADLPTDLWGFTDPAWQGRLGWAPTNGSFQAMITGMRSLWGEARTREWLQGIQANKPVVYDGNTPIVAAVGAGEIDAGFVNHYYLYRFLAEEGEAFPARNYFLPDGGPGSLIMVSGAAVLAGADNPAAGEQFLSFLLSTPGQQYFAAQTFEYPVVDGVAVDPLLPPLVELASVAADLSLTDLADLEGTARLLSEVGILP